MKKFILYLFICIFTPILTVANTPDEPEQEIQAQIPTVFIINAYSNHVEWSRRLCSELSAAISKKYPNLKVHIQNMKMDEVTNTSNTLLAFRAMIWSFDEQSGNYARALDARHIKAWQIFATNYRPCLVIIIGDEGLTTYQRWNAYSENWAQLPHLMWSTADTLYNTSWIPPAQVNPEYFAPIDARKIREIEVIDEHYARLNDSLKRLVQKQDTSRVLSVHYNLTGVISPLKIQENLELIKQLCPRLKELVYLDSDFYKTQTIEREIEKYVPLLLPDVKYSRIVQKKTNADSVFEVISQSGPQRAYLSYSWNTSAYISRYSQGYIDTLFTYKTRSPLFSLTPRDPNNNYWIGGYYTSSEEGIDKMLVQIEKALRKENLSEGSFQPIGACHYVLNQTALKRYGLYGKSKNLQDVVYVNVPLSFYRRYEKQILIGVILLIILSSSAFYLYRHYRYLKKTEKETDRFKLLYNKIQNMYNAAKIDFAIYNEKGDLAFCVIRGTRFEKKDAPEHLFSQNLFTNPVAKGLTAGRLQEGTVFNWEIEYSGTPYIFNIKQIQLTQHTEINYMAAMMDMTVIQKERNEKKLYEQMFELVCDFSKIGIAFYNYTEKTFTASEIWYENLCEANSSPELPEFSCVDPSDRRIVQSFLIQAKTNKKLPTFSGDVSVISPQGDQHWVRMNIFFNPNNPDVIIIFNLNTDDQKEKEQNLTHAKQKAELSNKEISEFLNNISHELRTPMNAIVGFSQVLSDVEGDERNEYINIIKINSDLLDNLVNNIIQLSKISSGFVTYNISVFKIYYLFYELRKNFEQMIAEKGLTFVIDCEDKELCVKSDRDYLYLVLFNLVTNAIKFTDSGKITVGVTNDTLYVQDTGCGISPADYARIFKEFEKVNTYTQGTGLGLALCKQIIEKLGGSLGVKSIPGEGSHFWIKLF